IRGVQRSGDREIVLVDLPGVHRPRDALTSRMAARVERELAHADAALLLLDGEQGVGPGDRHIARTLLDADIPVVVAVNKVDRLSKARVAAALLAAAQLCPDSEVFPISARTGAGVGELVGQLGDMLPEGPFMFEPGAASDQPLTLRLAELVREAVIRRTFQELPHAVEVV